jgi:predicted nucleotide-binding protein
MGYFIGRMTRERVCALYQEGVELPSDLAGIVYVPLDSNDQWQQVLLDELRAVGFDLKRQSELLVPVS